MSTAIYTSEKVMPYVYMGTHRETGQFYIGYRYANTCPSSCDLGTHYFTSSKRIKHLGFENFEWIILAEFFDKEAAWVVENEMIKEHFRDTLNLNQQVYGRLTAAGSKWTEERHKKHKEWWQSRSSEEKSITAAKKRAKAKGRKHTDEARAKISQNKIYSTEYRAKLSASSRGRKHTEEAKEKNRISHLAENLSAETRAKMSYSAKNRAPRTSTIIVCPHCGKEGGSGGGAMKRFHFDRCKSLVV